MRSYARRYFAQNEEFEGASAYTPVVVFESPDWKVDTDEAAVADGFVLFDTGDYVIDDLAMAGLPLFVQGQNVYVEN